MKVVEINESIAIANNNIQDEDGNTFTYTLLKDGRVVCEYDKSVYFPHIFRNNSLVIIDIELRDLQ